MPWSRRSTLVRSSSFGEVGVQRMDPDPVTILKKKRPAVGVECGGRSEGRSIRQEVGMIKNLDCKLMKDDEEEDLEGNYEESENGGDDVDGDQYVDCSFGVFLENCSFCKKRMRNMDVFMYGYLKAFCSPECRDVQIEMDERLRPPSPEPSLLSTIAKMVGASNAAKVTS
ncbi:DUF581 domain-containing protein [Heracleum sosnowskyi]|uniref:DUF581 domain-containing protein n=1 Tax=Heracleum sosnowskyi TaxID=360622 RepID=A0AAD8ILC3_9APIA|nr:DUF581 domain-containing protein [Heracleum sosnowskyi]